MPKMNLEILALAESPMSQAVYGTALASKANSLNMRLAAVANLANEYRQLSNVRNIARSYGISRPVMECFNFDNQLSNLPGMIAVESLDVVPLSPSTSRGQTFVASLTTALEGESCVIKDWMSKAIETGSTLMVIADAHLDGLLDQLRAVEEKLTGGTADDAALSMATTTAVPLSSVNAALDALGVIISDLAPIDASRLSDPEYRDGCAQALSEAQAHVADICGVSASERGVFSQDEDAVSDTYATQTQSLGDLGYTVDATVAAIGHAEAVLTALRSFLDQRAEIISGLEQAQEATPETSMEEGGDVDSAASADAVSDHSTLVCNYLCILSSVIRSTLDHAFGLIATAETLTDHTESV